MSPEQFGKELPVDKNIEQTPEQRQEMPERAIISDVKIQPAPLTGVQADMAQLAPEEKDEELLMIENILSEDILPLYSQLSEANKLTFKKKGEFVALKIKVILKKTTVKLHDIFELIKNWLAMLPKISIYFLDQEAKIKTDKIMQFKKEGQEIEK